jgi:hypothetical protein
MTELICKSVKPLMSMAEHLQVAAQAPHPLQRALFTFAVFPILVSSISMAL